MSIEYAWFKRVVFDERLWIQMIAISLAVSLPIKPLTTTILSCTPFSIHTASCLLLFTRWTISDWPQSTKSNGAVRDAVHQGHFMHPLSVRLQLASPRCALNSKPQFLSHSILMLLLLSDALLLCFRFDLFMCYSSSLEHFWFSLLYLYCCLCIFRLFYALKIFHLLRYFWGHRLFYKKHFATFESRFHKHLAHFSAIATGLQLSIEKNNSRIEEF